MKVLKSVPVLANLQLVLFDDNISLIRVSRSDGTMLSWRGNEYPYKDLPPLSFNESSTRETVFQMWREELEKRIRSHGMPNEPKAEAIAEAVDEAPEPKVDIAATPQERITMLEQAVGILMDERKERLSSQGTNQRAVQTGALGILEALAQSDSRPKYPAADRPESPTVLAQSDSRPKYPAADRPESPTVLDGECENPLCPCHRVFGSMQEPTGPGLLGRSLFQKDPAPALKKPLITPRLIDILKSIGFEVIEFP